MTPRRRPRAVVAGCVGASVLGGRTVMGHLRTSCPHGRTTTADMEESSGEGGRSHTRVQARSTSARHVALNDVPRATVGNVPSTSALTGAVIGSMHTKRDLGGA